MQILQDGKGNVNIYGDGNIIYIQDPGPQNKTPRPDDSRPPLLALCAFIWIGIGVLAFVGMALPI